MAAKIIGRSTVLASGLMLAVGLHAPCHAQSSQDFQMRLSYAVTYTPFEPNGRIDSTPPYTLCANNQMGLRFTYTWRNSFSEYIYTEAVTALYPYMYMQGVNPNPVQVPAAQVGYPVTRMVDVGLISGQVNTSGNRQVIFRGRTSGFFGNPVLTASATVLVETQIPPVPTGYREIEDRSVDMPTRPWFAWSDSMSADSYRLDIGQCSIQDPNTLDCGIATLPSVLVNPVCSNAALCWTGTENEHQLAQSLATDTRYQYRVHGLNQCGLNTPPAVMPSFRTAQACFTTGGAIPDGGSVNFDVMTTSLLPNSLAADLRVTVHADHPDVSDLRISLTKTSPVVAGPLLLLDRPSGANCAGPRIQASFGDGGAPAGSSCNALEPALNGRLSPAQSLASFAPVQGAGTWRLTIEDTDADGKAGSLLEWCLSTNSAVPLRAAAFVDPMIFASGFE